MIILKLSDYLSVKSIMGAFSSDFATLKKLGLVRAFCTQPGYNFLFNFGDLKGDLNGENFGENLREFFFV